MNLLIWITTGVVLGGIVSLLNSRNVVRDRLDYVLNIASGIAGAVLGGCLLAPLFGTGAIDIDKFSNGKWIAAIGGAAILLAIINLARAKDGMNHTD